MNVPSVISTTVAGGLPPIPLQCSSPAQSPVSHDPLPLASKQHPCLPQILPDHRSGTFRTASLPEVRWKPPSLGVGWPAPPSIPGHTLSLQLLTSMSWVPSACNQRGRTNHYKSSTLPYLSVVKAMTEERKSEMKRMFRERERERERERVCLFEDRKSYLRMRR